MALPSLLACVDALNGLAHAVVGAKASEKCCPLLKGVADLDAALCLCTTIKAKALSINLVLPIAIEVLVNECHKNVPLIKLANHRLGLASAALAAGARDMCGGWRMRRAAGGGSTWLRGAGGRCVASPVTEASVAARVAQRGCGGARGRAVRRGCGGARGRHTATALLVVSLARRAGGLLGVGVRVPCDGVSAAPR
ncbi:36.4 kDa proline-rich protein-like [Panicum miliaceum]|uniref:36.4 kDa proline-rich protein-like n=1 Tax=Panicum miliaceum TaxID=4540 RepID=A0A3L6Q6E5_PANMI|nr:36.4 kDa proline-rich protein-like [Panicum miliaceum]